MKIEEILKKHNKSVTKERIEIYESFKEHHIFTSSQIIDEKIFSRASIFRSIWVFLEIWVLRKISTWEKWDSYEIIEENESHHEHMKCNNCWDIIHFDSHKICTEIFEEAKKSWFEIDEHSIFINGKCKKCK